MEISGYACGYLASIFYLSSRFPQLYKNVSDNIWVILWRGGGLRFNRMAGLGDMRSERVRGGEERLKVDGAKIEETNEEHMLFNL